MNYKGGMGCWREVQEGRAIWILSLSPIVVLQKPTKYCKTIIFLLKYILKNVKKREGKEIYKTIYLKVKSSNFKMALLKVSLQKKKIRIRISGT